MKLYGTQNSPYVRKVRITARELGVVLQLERADAHALPSGYGAINPINRIPALQLDDGAMMFDSRVICEYLDCYADGALLPRSGAARWEVMKFIVFGDGILDAAVPRYGELLRPSTQQSESRLAKYERSIRQILDALEREVGGLDPPHLGSIAVGCALGYLGFRFGHEPWGPERPRLLRWYRPFVERPSIASTDHHNDFL